MHCIVLTDRAGNPMEEEEEEDLLPGGDEICFWEKQIFI